ncbi:MAG: hypothetical protein BroJett009_08170 [Armatimonadota bacterium]|nr:MAG: hypothetical protein BroJett009_08170 [Armatimonadota bacterium]
MVAEKFEWDVDESLAFADEVLKAHLQERVDQGLSGLGSSDDSGGPDLPSAKEDFERDDSVARVKDGLPRQICVRRRIELGRGAHKRMFGSRQAHR